MAASLRQTQGQDMEKARRAPARQDG
jgi:hypothetical protein